MPEASVSAVRVEIDTDLEDTAIQDILHRVERDVNRAYDGSDITFADAQHRADFEAVLAALRIATGRDRRKASVSRGDVSWKYRAKADSIARLQGAVARLDPGDAFATPGAVRRDTDRTVRSTSPSGHDHDHD